MKKQNFILKYVYIFLIINISLFCGSILVSLFMKTEIKDFSFTQFFYSFVFAFLFFNLFCFYKLKNILEYENDLINDFFTITKKPLSLLKDKWFFIALIILIVVIYGYEITNFALSIDEELQMAQNKNSLQWCYEGRFSIAILKGIFMQFGEYPPFFANIIAVLCYASSGVVILTIINMALKYEKFGILSEIVFMAGYMSFPAVVFEFMSFNTYNIEVSIGIFIMSLSVMFLCEYYNDAKKRYLFFSILLCCFSLGVYQAMVNLFIAVVIIYFTLISFSISNKAELKRFILNITYSILILLISLFIFYIFYKIATTIHTVELSIEYVNNFSGWSDTDSVWNSIKRSIQSLYDILSIKGTLVNRFFQLFILFGCIDAIVVVIIKHDLKSILSSFLVLLATFSAFIMWLGLASSFLPYRAWLAAPCVCGFIYSFFLYLLTPVMKKYKVFETAITLLICIILFRQIQTLSFMFYSDYIRSEKDIDFAKGIYNDICKEIGQIDENTPIVFIGVRDLGEDEAIIKNPSTNNYFGGNSLGYSLWKRAQEPERMEGLFKSIGYSLKFENCEDDQILYSMNQTMKTYPQKGSICYYNEKIYVKLQELEDGFKQQGDDTYYYRNGVPVGGITKIEDDWYYFDVEKKMKTGFVEIGGNEYLFDSNGKMVFGKYIIDNEVYCFDNKTGILISKETPKKISEFDAALWDNSIENSQNYLYGSYPIESDADSKYVWISDNVSTVIYNNMKTKLIDINGYINMDIYNMIDVDEIEVNVYIDGNLVKSTTYSDSGKVHVCIDKNQVKKEYFVLTIKTSTMVNPQASDIGNDARDLCWILNSIKQE